MKPAKSKENAILLTSKKWSGLIKSEKTSFIRKYLFEWNLVDFELPFKPKILDPNTKSRAWLKKF